MARSPIRRVGGKFYLAHKIVKLFPEHKCYIEPFGGAMHVLFRKPPSTVEVFNDIDSNLVNFFSCVRDYPEQLIKRLDYTFHSREIFEKALQNLNTGTELDRAVNFFVVNKQCFGGKMRSWGVDTTGNSGYHDFERRIREAYDRIKKIYIENRDYKRVIQCFDRTDSLFYCDPPYIFNEHRGRDKLYPNEMTYADHVELVELLKGIKGKFILSGYENKLYDYFERVELGVSRMHIKLVKDDTRTEKTE